MSKEKLTTEQNAISLRRVLNSGIYNVSGLGHKANITHQRMHNLKNGYTPRIKEFEAIKQVISSYQLD